MNSKDKTYGIIFFNYDAGKLYVYIKQNSKDYYEDFLDMLDIGMIVSLTNVLSPLYKSTNYEKNHTTLLLNMKKYKTIFDNICDKKCIKKINLREFNSSSVHKIMKHNRIKYFGLNNSFDIIRNNYIIRNKLMNL